MAVSELATCFRARQLISAWPDHPSLGWTSPRGRPRNLVHRLRTPRRNGSWASSAAGRPIGPSAMRPYRISYAADDGSK